ncbi:hypothetical protein [Xanthobacter sp.]|uniref:hypothetical protein n=1 Tax=Xanthobacter sp. TaxID=35809 RepID=UPI0025D73518|nr:hypothetical protein [Xanthobacter sp.]
MDSSELIRFAVIALFYIAVRTLWRAIRHRKRSAPEPAYRRSVPMPKFEYERSVPMPEFAYRRSFPVPFSRGWVADVKRMWMGSCGYAVLGDDIHTEDHAKIYQFIIDICNKSDISEDDRHVLKLAYQGCDYEKRLEETKSVRDELLRTVRQRIKDPSSTRFPG